MDREGELYKSDVDDQESAGDAYNPKLWGVIPDRQWTRPVQPAQSEEDKLDRAIATMGDIWKGVECQCDQSVGYVCEACAILSAQATARREVAALRTKLSERMREHEALVVIRDWRPGVTYDGNIFDAQEIARAALDGRR